MRAVQNSAELRRILALPRRTWDGQLAEALTWFLRTPEGTQSLFPVQAAALAEAHDQGGLFAMIPVGGGKTLISYLLPVILEAERPLLLIPAKLRDKTKREFALLSRHWRGHPRYQIESYERVSVRPTLIEQYQPTLVVCDEAHRMKNPRAACTRRMARYLDLSAHPCAVMAMSGTFAKRSIRDYAHILAWIFGTRAPVPLHYYEIQEWAAALDEKVREECRLGVGALAALAGPEDAVDAEDDLTVVRRGFRRRLISTPGVIASYEDRLGTSLSISAVEPTYNEATEAAFRQILAHWETPDGHPIPDGATLWRHMRELAMGFYYVWDPRPPADWLSARREWYAASRHILSTNRRDLDSEAQVALEVSRGHYPEHIDVYNAWCNIRDTFEPQTKPVWLDDGPLRFCEEWAQKNSGGIVWVEHVAFGEALAERTGLGYFREGGKDRAGRAIEAVDPSETVIASIDSNFEGRNLQARNANLVVSPPPTGLRWEQLLGRTHRRGQEADEVSCDVVIGCRQQWADFEQARADARFLEDSIGPAKLTYADITMPDEWDIALKKSARYASIKK